MRKATELSKAKEELIENNIPVTTIGEHGYVALIGVYGSDSHIANVARTTSSSKSKDDRSLLRYLVRNRHTSPLEFAKLEFELALPIFVDRQLIRHRMSSTNEVSARYAELPSETWDIPLSRVVGKPKEGSSRQGSGDDSFLDKTKLFIKNLMNNSMKEAVNTYKGLTGKGLSLEVARSVLPLSTFTRKRWMIDLHNLLHFLELRLDPHAQEEIRLYAQAIADFVKIKFPIIWKAFEDYRLNALTFSNDELEIMLEAINIESILLKLKEETILGVTEKQEFIKKLNSIQKRRL